jgi:hypothetical protein
MSRKNRKSAATITNDLLEHIQEQTDDLDPEISEDVYSRLIDELQSLLDDPYENLQDDDEDEDEDE